MEIIKKHRNRNNYYLTKQGFWVRDFSKPVKSEDINHFTKTEDFKVLISNQIQNMVLQLPKIDVERAFHPLCVIVSDGYQFEENLPLLEKISKKGATIIGTNGVLTKWKTNIKMDYYIVNNPYPQCLSYLPTMINYYPKCIASCRTHPEFLRRYLSRNGIVYQYTPTTTSKFGGMPSYSTYTIDDYRNPICAAINFCFRWEVQRLLLFCCDEVFSGERPSAERLKNGLYMYPQHHISQDLIEGNLYWLRKYNSNIKIGNYSSGLEYESVPYINNDEVMEFFA